VRVGPACPMRPRSQMKHWPRTNPAARRAGKGSRIPCQVRLPFLFSGGRPSERQSPQARLPSGQSCPRSSSWPPAHAGTTRKSRHRVMRSGSSRRLASWNNIPKPILMQQGARPPPRQAGPTADAPIAPDPSAVGLQACQGIRHHHVRGGGSHYLPVVNIESQAPWIEPMPGLVTSLRASNLK
jgi:hypothetical protein